MSPSKRKSASQSAVAAVDDVRAAEELQRLGVEAEVLQGPQRPAHAGHHAVAPAGRQPPREQLEHAAAVGRAGLQGRLQHRQLVVVGEQGGGRHLAGAPRGLGALVAGSGDGHGLTLASRSPVPTEAAGLRMMGAMSGTEGGAVVPAGGTAVVERPLEQTVPQTPWVTIVWDDPVNLMSYVTHVFVTYFHYPKSKATKLMMQVHNDGKAVVSSGTREEMERDVGAMHEFGLWATLDHADG